MSVTQNYKTITLSDDAHLHAIIAVTSQLLVDCAAKRAPGEEYDKFLAEQIATGTETLNALNATTVTATAVMASNAARGTLADLDEGMQRLVISAMYDMRVDRVKHLHNMVDGKRKYDEGVPCAMGICQADVERARTALEEVDAALLFLESPK